MTLAVGPVAVISLMTASWSIAPDSPSLRCSDLAEPAIRRHPLGLGFARAGFLTNLLSHSVISGFISASAILIAVGQLKHILGIRVYGHYAINFT